MHIGGVLIGLISFLIIGICHPLVIKGEYYFSAKIWPIFLAAGICFLGLSLLVSNAVGSAALGVAGFSCLWSIKELKEQAQRVEKGWFPRNPKRKAEDSALSKQAKTPKQ